MDDPWLFSRSLFLLQDVEGIIKRQDIVFNTFDAWVQVYGLPPLGYTKPMGIKIGSRIGSVLEVQEKKRLSWSGGSYGKGFLRLKIQMKIDSKLPRGFSLSQEDGSQTWVYLRYEKLPNFCFGCGKIGHVIQECSAFGSIKPSDLQYGEWLRANSVGRHPFQSMGRDDGGGTSSEPEMASPEAVNNIKEVLPTETARSGGMQVAVTSNC